MKIKIPRDPYNMCFNICTKREIYLNEGLTVLVGCNGAGKTTMIRCIEDHCKINKIPVCYFDNLHDGGKYFIDSLGFSRDGVGFAQAVCSSEGERLLQAVSNKLSKLNNFVMDGKTDKNIFESIFADKTEEIPSDIRVFLFDATDSGLSIDSIINIKNLFYTIIEYGKKVEKEIYIVISANEYELPRNEQCLDVTTGKYIHFKTYESYRKFIIKTREKKNNRNDVSYYKRLKRRLKEINKRINVVQKINSCEKDSFRAWKKTSLHAWNDNLEDLLKEKNEIESILNEHNMKEES